MPRIGNSPLAFPDFRGATRRLVLINLVAYFALAIAGLLAPEATGHVLSRLVFIPSTFLHGQLWQPLTYSLVHPTSMVVATFFELLSLYFLAGFLEPFHGDSWLTGLFIVSVLGTTVAALALYAGGAAIGHPVDQIPLYGCFGSIFGMLVVIGVLYGDMEFLMFFLFSIKARYMAIIYGLVALAYLFGEQRIYAFAQLGGALAGWLYVRLLPRRGFNFLFSEQFYGLRNRYYRWKRRRAARKFEVYMRSQGRTVRFDGQGRQIDEDHDDKTRWN